LEDAGLVQQKSQRLELPKTRLALVVDQLEELFTTGFPLEVRQKHISAIADLVRSGREWQRVKDWLKKNREFLRMRDRLDASERQWKLKERHRDYLLPAGLPLAEAERGSLARTAATNRRPTIRMRSFGGFGSRKALFTHKAE
jgi:hypothetical protein